MLWNFDIAERKTQSHLFQLNLTRKVFVDARLLFYGLLFCSSIGVERSVFVFESFCWKQLFDKDPSWNVWSVKIAYS